MTDGILASLMATDLLRDPSFRLLLETAMDAVVIMRADGTIADWSPSAEDMFGWSREEAIGQEMAHMIIPERYRERHFRGLETYLETGESTMLRKRVLVSALRMSGEEFPVELSICPLLRGGQTLFIGFLRDALAPLEAAKP